ERLCVPESSRLAVKDARPARSLGSKVPPLLSTMFIETIGSSDCLTIQTFRPFESLVFSIAGNANVGSGPGFGRFLVYSSRLSSFSLAAVDVGLFAADVAT